MSQRMSITIEERVGDKSPRAFKTGQAVLLRDLRSTATSKWRPAVISHKHGPLAYEVNIDGQTRQAHIDHLKPNPQPVLPEHDTDNQPVNDKSLTDEAIDDSNSVILNPLLFTDNEPNLEEEHEQQVTELDQRPQRHRKPTRRLIEEIP